MRPSDQITIIGLGVIGGSLAKALKRGRPALRIMGVDETVVTRRAAAEGVIDAAFPPGSVRESLQGSSTVFLCTPVSTIIELLPVVGGAAEPGTIITDTGSTKRAISATAAECIPPACPFIGGHPMTGNEGSSWDWSDPLLFENAAYILTPGTETPETALRSLTALLETTGARIALLDAAEHDRITAMVSHLPQLLAVTLMNAAAGKNRNNELYLKMAAGGFRDMTRIASSPWDIWKDIIDTNDDEIVQVLDGFIADLSGLRYILKEPDLEDRFTRAARGRLSIPRDCGGFARPGYDLRLWLEDRPGIIAGITAVLAEHRINISDIEILKVREGDAGTLRISFAAEHIRARARSLLEQAGFPTVSQQGSSGSDTITLNSDQ